MRLFSKLFKYFVLCALITVGGVSAAFIYVNTPENVIANQKFGVAQFEYAPEEVLPDTPEDTVNQTNHNAVIYELLYNDKMGLNGGGTSLPSQVEKYGLLPYLQSITGGNLKHLIDVSVGGQNLGFDLEYINDDSFYAYSYYRYDHTHGETIVAYRTLVKKNTDASVDGDGDGRMDKWTAAASVKGWAPALEYAYDKKKGKMQFRIDVEKWTNYEGII